MCIRDSRYLASEKDDDVLSKRIKEMTIAKGFHRDLKLDSTMSKPCLLYTSRCV